MTPSGRNFWNIGSNNEKLVLPINPDEGTNEGDFFEVFFWFPFDLALVLWDPFEGPVENVARARRVSRVILLRIIMLPASGTFIKGLGPLYGSKARPLAARPYRVFPAVNNSGDCFKVINVILFMFAL